MDSTYTKDTQKRLDKDDVKTLALSSLGGTLEFYDFIIYALYIETIIKPLFLPAHLANTVWGDVFGWGGFAAGYIARPIGGVIMAHFGDILGRKKMFTLSIAMMALPTFMIGLLPTYESIGFIAPVILILLRIVQGAAIGGEMPGAWVFIAEHVKKAHYGRGIGILTSGITGGIVCGFLVSLIISLNFTSEEITAGAWRIPFIIGGIFGVISVYLRKFLSETPIFKELSKKRQIAKEIPVLIVLKQHLKSVLLVGLLTWSLSTVILVGVIITPVKIIKDFHIDDVHIKIVGIIIASGLTLGCILCGYLEDKFKSKKMMVIMWGGLILSAFYFYHSLGADMEIHLLYFNAAIFGLFTGSVATVPILGARSFPAAVRYSGLALSYNFSYAVFSFFTPGLTFYLLRHTSYGAAIYISFVALLAIAIGFVSKNLRYE